MSAVLSDGTLVASPEDTQPVYTFTPPADMQFRLALITDDGVSHPVSSYYSAGIQAWSILPPQAGGLLAALGGVNANNAYGLMDGDLKIAANFGLPADKVRLSIVAADGTVIV